MSDIKLFSISGGKVFELQGKSVALEKSLQNLMEANLEAFLGVRFLASEYYTGKAFRGKIDTLGLDENGCPVIIEYKRTLNENVINQGLFYLDWLMDHKAEFELLVMKNIGKKEFETIEWGAPRLLCIAGDFTKYDEHAVAQINRNIELIRYRKNGDELLLLDLVNATTATSSASGSSFAVADSTAPSKAVAAPVKYKTVSEYLSDANQGLTDLFEALKDYLSALGDDVQMKILRFYIAFKRIKNFACLEIRPKSNVLLVYVKVNPDSVALEKGFTRDVRKIGHYGTGDLEITIRSEEDLEKAKDLILKSYEAS
ncbi:Predicted transport protein [Desulfatibacillum alkenivorans DSM 16219]|jgi:predicted transport protein|uniref:Predicted transport protein n=1 Tax=Desulfatibacillum alkenivorans DSM 16219 TaxID=1121393 RepID=A0A1M6YKI0_9BACT|nr:DUF5655 domain-containing protein [Desulfatibacillum alkenivorans]SHL18747.1 Predicted transport protein [Desulfatibacillum alkenivorans DSM 16219]